MGCWRRPGERMDRLKHAAKVAIAQGLYALGLLQLWQRWSLRRRTVVLMYHRVLTEDERRRTGSHPGIVVTRGTFARQMELLVRRFTVLSVDQFADHLARGVPLPDSSCLITFDDGWLDNLDGAVPVLRQHLLPSLVFLPVNFIGQQRLFWREALTHLLVHAAGEARRDASLAWRLRTLLEPHGLAGAIDVRGNSARQRICALVVGRTGMRAPEAERLIESLSDVLQVTVDQLGTPDRFIDWAQVEEMAREGVDFGGHGSEHRLLGELAAPEAEDDIRTSKTTLDERMASRVTAFSYPNGSFTPHVVRLVQAAGYRLAFTTVSGPVQCGDDPFTLRRINIHEDMTASPAMFLARLVGLF